MSKLITKNKNSLKSIVIISSIGLISASLTVRLHSKRFLCTMPNLSLFWMKTEVLFKNYHLSTNFIRSLKKKNGWNAWIKLKNKKLSFLHSRFEMNFKYMLCYVIIVLKSKKKINLNFKIFTFHISALSTVWKRLAMKYEP